MTQGTAQELYSVGPQPDPEVDELCRVPGDTHTRRSYDGEIARLRAQDEAEQYLQLTLQRAGWQGPTIWEMRGTDRHRLLHLLEETQSYPEAVKAFMEEWDVHL